MTSVVGQFCCAVLSYKPTPRFQGNVMIEIETCKFTSGCTKLKLHRFGGHQLVNYVLTFALKVNMYCD